MRRRPLVVLVATLVFEALSLQVARPDSPEAPSGAGDPIVRPVAPDARKQEANDARVASLLERIRGREQEPASKVFKNIQLPWFKDVPAGNLLSIMNGGYSRALGVSCTHCHDELDFSSDEKRPKRAAREMARMHKMINEQLAAMKELEPEPGDRSINCMACHRGRLDPRKPG